jgi:hypothetical protein
LRGFRSVQQLQPLAGKAVGDAIFIRVVSDERDNPTTYPFRCERLTIALPLQHCLFGDSLPCCPYLWLYVSVHKEEVPFVLYVFLAIKQCGCLCFHALQARVLRWIKPPTTSLLLGTLADLARGKSELIAENAL